MSVKARNSNVFLYSRVVVRMYSVPSSDVIEKRKYASLRCDIMPNRFHPHIYISPTTATRLKTRPAEIGNENES